MNQQNDFISLGFKLGQGVSSLNRILCSLSLYKGSRKDEVLTHVLREVEDLIKKLTI